MKTMLKEDFKVVNTREGLRYYTATVEDPRQLKAYFDAKNKHMTPFSCGTIPLRVMLKRLPRVQMLGR